MYVCLILFFTSCSMVEQCKWSEGALAKPCTERNDDESISICAEFT